MPIVVGVGAASESAWIVDTTPEPNQTGVDRTGPLVVRVSKLLDVSCLTNQTFRLQTDDGIEVDDAFRIDPATDYNRATQEITLQLAQPLEPDTGYVLIIDGLVDAAGEVQDAPHFVPFITNDNDVDLTPQVGVEDVIAVVDNTIAAGDIAPSRPRAIAIAPIDGSYGIAETTETVSIVFPDGAPAGLSATVARRPVSYGDARFAEAACTVDVDPSGMAATITVPPLYNDVVFPAGHEVRIVLAAQDGWTQTLVYAGELRPLLASVTKVLSTFPSASAIEAASAVYLASQDLLEVDPDAEERVSRAGRDFVHYSALSLLADDRAPISYRLGDLAVDDAVGAAAWRRLADEALAAITKGLPRYGSNEDRLRMVGSWHAGRDWDDGGTSRRRVGER